MFLDAMTILACAILTTLYRRLGTDGGRQRILHGTLIDGRSMAILLVLLCGFAAALIVTSRRLKLDLLIRLNNAPP